MNKSERIEFIGAQRLAGKTLQEIGLALGITRERVRQIAKQFGFYVVRKKKPAYVKKNRLLPYAEIRKECKDRGLPDPYRKFVEHRNSARVRGIGFDLAFDEWWGIWKHHYHERGSRKGCKVMCRKNDLGPYAVGNCYVATGRHNWSVRGYRDTRSHAINPEIYDYKDRLNQLNPEQLLELSQQTMTDE